MINDFFESIKDNKVISAISVGVGIALLWILLGSGASLLVSLLFMVVIGLIVFFNHIPLLVSSFIIAFLMKYTLENFTKLFAIWTTSEKVNQTIILLGELNYFELTLMIFVLAKVMSFLTGSIKLFHFKNEIKTKSINQ